MSSEASSNRLRVHTCPANRILVKRWMELSSLQGWAHFAWQKHAHLRTTCCRWRDAQHVERNMAANGHVYMMCMPFHSANIILLLMIMTILILIRIIVLTIVAIIILTIIIIITNIAITTTLISSDDPREPPGRTATTGQARRRRWPPPQSVIINISSNV